MNVSTLILNQLNEGKLTIKAASFDLETHTVTVTMSLAKDFEQKSVCVLDEDACILYAKTVQSHNHPNHAKSSLRKLIADCNGQTAQEIARQWQERCNRTSAVNTRPTFPLVKYQ
jgi:hypothetical protein